MPVYTLNVGQYLAIQITGMKGKYVAEIVDTSPLKVKVKDDGPLANLKDGDFFILEKSSALFQVDEESFHKELRYNNAVDKPFFSGLASLGVTDGELHKIHPQWTI